MHQIEVTYQGGLRTKSVHCISGETILTDAPIDNCGKGENFSPTDLIVSALASCILTIMGIVAQRHRINIKGTICKVRKIMNDNPRKIAKIIIHISFPTIIEDQNKKILEKSANSCPVYKSLNSSIIKEINFQYPN